VTQLGCGRIYSDSFIANCLLILTVKEFWKSVNIWWSYEVYKKTAIFWPTLYLIWGDGGREGESKMRKEGGEVRRRELWKERKRKDEMGKGREGKGRRQAPQFRFLSTPLLRLGRAANPSIRGFWDWRKRPGSRDCNHYSRPIVHVTLSIQSFNSML